MPDSRLEAWELPPAVRGNDVRLRSNRRPAPALDRERVTRVAKRVPEAMVKVTGRTRGTSGHLKAHLDYITRNGRVHAETQDGELVADHDTLRAINDDWLLLNAVQGSARAKGKAAQSVNIILSMPPGTPPDRVQAAARTFARDTFAGHEWLMARHDDTSHPHVHLTVRAIGQDGRRLRPGRPDLQRWREGFARELRRLGIEAEATPRRLRGQVRRPEPLAGLKAKQRGAPQKADTAVRRLAEEDSRAPVPPQPRDWARDVQARQEAIRRDYLSHAAELEKGGEPDKVLAGDIRRFVAEMPVPLARRHALAAELRTVLDRHPGRHPAEQAPPPAPGILHGAKSADAPQVPSPSTRGILHGAKSTDGPGAPSPSRERGRR